jgi:hypothetical protein
MPTQPAPLSIALLGSVMVLAMSVPDFKLIVERVKDDPNLPVQWTYVQRPDSFKSCLQQMVGDGYTGTVRPLHLAFAYSCGAQPMRRRTRA